MIFCWTRPPAVRRVICTKWCFTDIHFRQTVPYCYGVREITFVEMKSLGQRSITVRQISDCSICTSWVIDVCFASCLVILCIYVHLLLLFTILITSVPHGCLAAPLHVVPSASTTISLFWYSLCSNFRGFGTSRLPFSVTAPLLSSLLLIKAAAKPE